jgi:hypothetical protein
MKISKIVRSRRQWKAKAQKRGAQIRNLRKTAQRRKTKLPRAPQPQVDPAPLGRLPEENAAPRAGLDHPHHPLPVARRPALLHRTWCVIIFVCGVTSFRCVPRLFAILQPLLRFPVRIPHFTSVIHWTLRVGMALFRQVVGLSEPWVALLDCSIDIGTRKALVVLRVPLRALHQKQKALGLQDCECIGLEISSAWNGARVAETLARVFEKTGCPVAVLKDGGADLKKGVELFCGRHPEKPIFQIEDIGHYIANLLKACYAGKKSFAAFLKIVARGATLIRQTNLAWLMPPQLRTKGRFQGITAVAHWAQKLLDLIGRPGQAASPSQARKARQAFSGLAPLRPFLTRFCQVCSLTERFLELLKNQGLNETTYQAAQDLLVQLPTRSLLRKRLAAWLEKHLQIFRALGHLEGSLPVSSDPIESLFGKFKTLIQRHPHAELNRLIFVLPVLCGNHSPAAIDQALHQCSHAQMRSVIEQTVPLTLRQTRQRNLGKPSFSVPISGDFSASDSG